MKIDLHTIDRNQFMVHKHVVNGELMHLVQPQHNGADWTQENKIFRSSVWTDEGKLVSAGFPKFTNWGEKPEVFPTPISLENTRIVEKLDGSLLIVSKHEGHIMLRTRGTVDASKLDNGFELEVFCQEYLPQCDEYFGCNVELGSWDTSLLFEWTSPVNKIVLNYGDEPDFVLVGLVRHENYSLADQDHLDFIAKNLGLKRPPVYNFPSIDDLMKGVEMWKGKEGVCVYSGRNYQVIHKVKVPWYLALHRMKEALSSIEKVIDFWYQQGQPSYQDFEKYITEKFDWEYWTQIRGEVSRVCDGSKEVSNIVAEMIHFVEASLRQLPTRKEQALKVMECYGKTKRVSYVFKLLDGKSLDTEDHKKLLYQVLKK